MHRGTEPVIKLDLQNFLFEVFSFYSLMALYIIDFLELKRLIEIQL